MFTCWEKQISCPLSPCLFQSLHAIQFEKKGRTGKNLFRWRKMKEKTSDAKQLSASHHTTLLFHRLFLDGKSNCRKEGTSLCTFFFETALDSLTEPFSSSNTQEYWTKEWMGIASGWNVEKELWLLSKGRKVCERERVSGRREGERGQDGRWNE